MLFPYQFNYFNAGNILVSLRLDSFIRSMKNLWLFFIQKLTFPYYNILNEYQTTTVSINEQTLQNHKRSKN